MNTLVVITNTNLSVRLLDSQINKMQIWLIYFKYRKTYQKRENQHQVERYIDKISKALLIKLLKHLYSKRKK